MNRQKAFTLIEIMVVVAIVAILAAVATNSFRSYSAKARWGEVQPCITDAALRLENYRTNHGKYPVEDVWSSINSSGACSDHYAGDITIFENGARYVVAFCDSQKSIWRGGRNDVWLAIDVGAAPIHYRNSVDEKGAEVPAAYSAEIPADCSATWTP